MDFLQQQQQDKSFLLIGLDIGHVLNPAQVFAELLQRPISDRAAGQSRELLSLEGPLRGGGSDLPRLIYDHHDDDGIGEQITVRKFRCRCPRVSVDGQRLARVANRQELPEREAKGEGESSWQLPEQAADVDTQLGLFGKLARNKLARRLKWARKINIRRQAALYKLEELLREANANLGANLLALCGESWARLAAVGALAAEGASGASLEANGGCEKHFRPGAAAAGAASLEVMIRAPAAQLPLEWLTLERTVKWGGWKSSSADEDSGVELPEVCGAHTRLETRPSLRLLEGALRFHCNGRIQAMVAFSIDFFARLLDETPLFALMKPTTETPPTKKIDEDTTTTTTSSLLLGPQEFKLLACVECQNLRWALNFKWLTGCLTLAFASQPEVAQECVELRNEQGHQLPRQPADLGPRQKGSKQQTTNGLLGLFAGRRAEEKLESELLARVSSLMSILLRQHFLSPALERLCGLFAGHQQLAPEAEPRARANNKAAPRRANSAAELASGRPTNKAARLLVQVELLERREQDGAQDKLGVSFAGGLAASRPEADLEATLAFVVDELASVCQRLPRLESKLNCLHASEEFLEVRVGELVGEAKARLGSLIDGSRALSTSGPNAKMESLNKLSRKNGGNCLESVWLNSDYLEALELLDRFQRGQPPTFDSDTFEEFANFVQIPEEFFASDDRLRQLRLSCRQIDLLNWLDARLEDGRIKRYQDFGFALIDYEPLRAGLVRCLRRERLLLIRIELDNLLKLMERLQLQFDEIELAIDLESAVEDYLAERQQARQQQPAQAAQAVILSGADLDLEDDLDLGELENQLGLEVDSIFVEDNYGPEVEARQENNKPAERRRLVSSEDEEFVVALTSFPNSNASNQQLLASEEKARAGATGSERELLELQQAQQRKLAPLIESQLLVEKFDYFSELLRTELKPLIGDLELVFEGCLFLSEHVSGLDAHLDCRTSSGDSSLEILRFLSARSQEFSQILSHSLRALVGARERLFKLNKLRSLVLSRLLLEFHQLVSSLGLQQLDRHAKTSRQLDSYQETADFAQKLASRCEFIGRQNRLLAKEINLLQLARLAPDLREAYPKLTVEDLEDSLQDSEHLERLQASSGSREAVLEKWAQLSELLASFWTLAEEYETQQVKWLNLDTKRIKFDAIEETFAGFEARLKSLEESAGELAEVEDERFRATFRANLKELAGRFELFRKRRLPIFKFLTNKHLTEAHWAQLGQLLSPNEPRNSIAAASAAQSCTTLAQFLELEGDVESVVDQLELMNKQTLLEHQLTQFLLAEARQDAPEADSVFSETNLKSTIVRRASQRHELDVSSWLEGWSESELVIAAGRFLGAKLAGSGECESIARKLVQVHSLMKRFLVLKYSSVGLVDSTSNSLRENSPNSVSQESLVLLAGGSARRLTSGELVQPALLVEFLRYFTRLLLERERKLASRIERVAERLASTRQHLEDIDELIGRVERLEASELRETEAETERMLIKLERETVKLEVERELLAAREAAALERQRLALRKRDECIRQISERAIPAIRAASRALECLDERSLRTLRCIRPKPPEPVRLVIEAVCLLRASFLGESPGSGSGTTARGERHFDALEGRVREDFWPSACRQLNGTHSHRFLADLRRLAGCPLAPEVMQRLRRDYLSRASFRVSSIGRVSAECGQLARWLVALDVFDRVINVVKPNYRSYLESERQLGELFGEVAARRRQMELIGSELAQMEESLEVKIGQKSLLLESLEECRAKLLQISSTRAELQSREAAGERKLRQLANRKQQLVPRCVNEAAGGVYLAAMRPADRVQAASLLAAVSRGQGFFYKNNLATDARRRQMEQSETSRQPTCVN